MPEWSAEITVDVDLARKLIGEQFPELPLRTVRLLGEGWDTIVWLVDDEWTFRFPRREYVITGIENEMALLPGLAPLLALPIPSPTLFGRPSDAYRWPFYGAPFLPGREIADAALTEEQRRHLARPLAEFLRGLHSLELDAELPVDPVRRADMSFRAPRTRELLGEAEGLGLWDPPPLVAEVLAAAESLPAPEPTAVVHGDLHLRHLLVDDSGTPSAVIDWIDLSRSEAGVDFVLFWCLLPPRGPHRVPGRLRDGRRGAAAPRAGAVALSVRHARGVRAARGHAGARADGNRRAGADRCRVAASMAGGGLG